MWICPPGPVRKISEHGKPAAVRLQCEYRASHLPGAPSYVPFAAGSRSVQCAIRPLDKLAERSGSREVGQYAETFDGGEGLSVSRADQYATSDRERGEKSKDDLIQEFHNSVSRLDGAVKALAGRREQVPKFNEAGRGRGFRGAGGPGADQVRSALQAVGGAGEPFKADELAAADVLI